MSTGGTHNVFQFLVLVLYLGISWADEELTDDGLDSKIEESAAPSPSPVPGGGNERSAIILSWIIISVGIIVLTFFFWTMKTQIKDFIIKVSLSCSRQHVLYTLHVLLLVARRSHVTFQCSSSYSSI